MECNCRSAMDHVKLVEFAKKCDGINAYDFDNMENPLQVGAALHEGLIMVDGNGILRYR